MKKKPTQFSIDTVMYGFHLARGKELPSLVQNISLGPTGINFRMEYWLSLNYLLNNSYFSQLVDYP